MKTPRCLRSVELFCIGIGTLVSLSVGSAQADPLPPATLPAPVAAPAGLPVGPEIPQQDADKEEREKRWAGLEKMLEPVRAASLRARSLPQGLVRGEPKKPRKVFENVTLDYERATSNCSEVLNAKVTVQLKSASFLSALDSVMDASAKTCRIECRQIHTMRLSMNVREAPVAGLLDSLAKLGGARLYVLPSRLIIAPEKALADDEKKTAKLYGVLLTAATLPDTPGAKALTIPGGKRKKSILEVANTKISGSFEDFPIATYFEDSLLSRHSTVDGHYGMGESYYLLFRGSIPAADWVASVSVSFEDVSYGDALASLANLVDCDLYLTPTHFFMYSRNKRPSSIGPNKNMVPAFVPSSTTFLDPAANRS